MGLNLLKTVVMKRFLLILLLTTMNITAQAQEIERVKKAMNDWQPVEAEVINYRKNGEEFWMNFSI